MRTAISLAALACAACAWMPPVSAGAGEPPTNSTPACGVTTSADPDYRDHVLPMDRALGIPDDYAQTHALSLVPEARELVVAGRDVRGREVELSPNAAVALQEMIVAAEGEGVKLRIVSGYRSADYQASLLRDKLRRHMKLETALRINAPPGYSEHQSGCAVDLTTPHARAADESFARTPAYAWLARHAGEYGFRLSYPENNPHGIEFEPWHWRFVAHDAGSAPSRVPAAAEPATNAPAASASTGMPNDR